jgi:Pectate lyase superfamily protein
MADIAFTNYQFAATGSATSRTMPERISDVVNVKDWGAKGNGNDDDTLAIQAAVDHAWSLTPAGAMIFFPRGTYIVSSPGILLARKTAPYGGGLTIVGAGRDATVIKGNYSGGFLVRCNPLVATDNLDVMRDLTIWNQSQVSGSGAFFDSYTEKAAIVNCHFKGIIGAAVDAVAANFGMTFRECLFTCSAAAPVAGSVGVYTEQGQTINCRANGFDVGFALSAITPNIIGCHASNCNTGIRLGYARQVQQESCQGSGCISNQVDGCIIGIDGRNLKGLVASNIVSGTTGPGGAPIQYGIKIAFAQDFTMCSNVLSASASAASVWLGAAGNSIFVNCFCASMQGPDGWSPPAGLFNAASQWSFVNCGMPGASPPVAFNVYSEAAACPFDGREFNIINAQLQNSFGGVVTGGGSNHYKVRYDGTNWVRVG